MFALHADLYVMIALYDNMRREMLSGDTKIKKERHNVLNNGEC